LAFALAAWCAAVVVAALVAAGALVVVVVGEFVVDDAAPQALTATARTRAAPGIRRCLIAFSQFSWRVPVLMAFSQFSQFLRWIGRIEKDAAERPLVPEPDLNKL
jgi:uncharacterized Fe-S cluster-containing radical SAM superfamily enzyme